MELFSQGFYQGSYRKLNVKYTQKSLREFGIHTLLYSKQFPMQQ